jgi:hypothetical protein
MIHESTFMEISEWLKHQVYKNSVYRSALYAINRDVIVSCGVDKHICTS